MKKAIQFAREQCSNFKSDASCLGIDINDDGSLSGFGAKPKCLLLLGKRCPFFEKAVLPMGVDIEIGSTMQRARNRALAELRDAAGFEYRRLGGAATKGAGKRPCPECKGRELQPRERLCYLCRDKARKETQRRANSNRRKYNS